MNTILAWDTNLFLHIFGWNGRVYLDRFMKFITRTGDGFLYPVLGVMILLLDWETGLKVVLPGLLAFAIELPIYKIIKSKTIRLRPFEALPGIINLVHAPDKYSFPSGHTAAAFIMAIVIASAFPALALPMIIWASSIGLSRIYLGVHYPTDVLVGMMIGIGSALTAIQIIA
jgi:undecaprenyl-diphosphatase